MPDNSKKFTIYINVTMPFGTVVEYRVQLGHHELLWSLQAHNPVQLATYLR